MSRRPRPPILPPRPPKARQTLPADWPGDAPTHKACPDCYAAGRDPYLLPVATHFYIKKVPRSHYKGGYRVSAYCIEHDVARKAAWKAARKAAWAEEEARTGVPPAAAVAWRERERVTQRALRAKGKTEAQQIAERAWLRANYAKHREKFLAANAAWAAIPANKAANAARKAAWYQRVGKARARARREAAFAAVPPKPAAAAVPPKPAAAAGPPKPAAAAGPPKPTS